MATREGKGGHQTAEMNVLIIHLSFDYYVDYRLKTNGKIRPSGARHKVTVP